MILIYCYLVGNVLPFVGKIVCVYFALQLLPISIKRQQLQPEQQQQQSGKGQGEPGELQLKSK